MQRLRIRSGQETSRILPQAKAGYLAVIIDHHSRQVIGWSMDTRRTATLACNALSIALFRLGFPNEVIVHSDRGSQYCSKVYLDLITAYNLKQSMSRKRSC